jgi:hypothetical protein
MECTFSNSKLNIAMPLDSLDEIVRAYLRDQVLRFEHDITSLIEKDNLDVREKEDLKDWVDYRDAHLRVLQYISDYSEHKSWIKKHNLGIYILEF